MRKPRNLNGDEARRLCAREPMRLNSAFARPFSRLTRRLQLIRLTALKPTFTLRSSEPEESSAKKQERC